MKNIFIIGGNSDMALYFVNMAAKNNYKITLSSKNKEKLIENFGEKKDLTLIHLDLTEQLQTEKFIKSLNLPFDDIICFSGKLNQNCFDKKNLIISNYLGIKKFIILYRKKFENLTKFMVITSVAALKIDAKQNIYSFSKKKLRDFLFKEDKKENFICNIMPGYTNTKMVKNKNLIFKLLSSSAKSVGYKIFLILEEKHRKKEYVIPSYWIIIIKLYNILKKFFSA